MILINYIKNYLYKAPINYLKTVFNLNKFTEFEKVGKISFFTKLKFIPNSDVFIPFELGRTIRGLSFKKNLNKDPFGKFVLNMKKGKSKKN